MVLLQTDIPEQEAGDLSDYVPILGKAVIITFFMKKEKTLFSISYKCAIAMICCPQVDRGRAGGHRLDAV